jgi:hypothetical protein
MDRFPGFASYKRSRICAALFLMATFLFGLALAPQWANAKIVVETITGTVISPLGGLSQDEFGNVFSSSGKDTILTGLPFTLG